MTKIATDLEQSKKLAVSLPIESADMRIGNYVGESGKVDGTNVHYYLKGESFGAPEIIYAWSLSALINLMPETIEDSIGTLFGLNIKKNFVEYYNPSMGALYATYLSVNAETLVDACVEMIIQLKERDLL